MKKVFISKSFKALFIENNGHFSLTGHVSGDFGNSSGAISEKLVAIDPYFKPLADLHLCDVITGMPLHAFNNAIFYAKKRNWNKACDCLHLRDNEKLAQAFVAAVIDGETEKLTDIMTEIKSIWIERVADLDDAIEALEEYFPENRAEFIEPLDENGVVIEAYADIDEYQELDRRTALARHLDCNISEVEPAKYGENTYDAQGMEWLVLTNEEADAAFNESLDNYIDDVLEIPAWIVPYFNREAWKNDARHDGRGNALSRYDGEEHEEYGASLTNRVMYFIYKQ